MTDTQYLYLARHGRTALNAEGRLRGLADPPLDPTGEAEAARLADALRDSGAELVVSSPLQRAVRTAQAIAEALGVPHRADPRFNDRDYGPQTGELKSEVVAKWGDVDSAPGVESVETVLARSLPALDALLDDPVSGTASAAPRAVIVVTHDAVIRPLLRSIDPGVEVEVPTASYARLRRGGEGWAILDTDVKPA